MKVDNKALSLFLYAYRPEEALQRLGMQRLVKSLQFFHNKPQVLGNISSHTKLMGWLDKSLHFKMWAGAEEATATPSSWGPIVWQFLHHYAARSSTAVEKTYFNRLLFGVSKLLPCPKCKEHFAVILSQSKRKREKWASKRYTDWLHRTVTYEIMKRVHSSQKSEQ